MVSFVIGGAGLVLFALGCLPMVVVATVVVVMATFRCNSQFGCVCGSYGVVWVAVTVMGLLVVVVIAYSQPHISASITIRPETKISFLDVNNASVRNRSINVTLFSSVIYVPVLQPRPNDQNNRGRYPFLHWCF